MIKTMTMDDLHNQLKSITKDELILDVRTPSEYASGHVPGSKNIPHDQVATRAEDLKKYKQVYLYCRSGGRVQFACQELTQLGLQNLTAVVGGGMPDWLASGYPTEN